MSIRRDKIQLDVEINGQKAGQSYRELINDSRNLKRELLALTPGTQAFIDKSKELQAVNSRLADIRAQTRGVRREGNSVLNTFKKFAPVLGAAFVIDGARRFFSFISEQVSEIDLIKNKFNTVFGDAAVIVESSAKSQAISLGLTTREYQKLTAATGDLLIPMGFQRTEAAKLSTDLVGLSASLSAWTGGQKSSADVSDILTKALLGEREQLKTLGISIQEADVKARLADKGLSKLTGTALQQAKAMATLELITEKSGDAQESFAKNSQGLIQTKARLSARIRNISQQMAGAFVPIFERGLAVVEKMITGLLTFGGTLASIPKFVQENRVAIIGLLTALISLNAHSILANANLLRIAAATRAGTIATAAQTIAQRGLNAVMKANPIGLVIAAISTLISLFSVAYNRSERFRASIDGVKNLAKEAFKIIVEAFTAFSKGFSEIKKGNFKAAFKSFSEGLIKANPITAAITQGRRLANAYSDGVKESLEKSKLEDELDIITPSAAGLIDKGQNAGADIGGATGDAIVDGINKRLSNLSIDVPSADAPTDSPNTSSEAPASTNEILKKELDQLKAQGELKQDQLKLQLLQQQITETEHNEQSFKVRKANFDAQLQLLKNYGREESEAYLDISIDQLEDEKEHADRRIAATLTELEKLSQGELSELQLRFLNRMLTEQEYEEASLQSQADHLERRRVLLEQAGLLETDAYRENQQAQFDIQKDIDDKKLENAKRTADIRNELEAARTEGLKTAIDFGISLLSKDQSARKKHAGVIKAFELGKVGVNLASEISGIRTAHAAIPPPLGPALSATRIAIAIGKSLIQANRIRRQKFFHGGHVQGNRGGYTGYDRLFHDGQDYVVDADVHEGEYVNPKWQVRHPVYGRVISWLDEGRRGKHSFFEGGLVNVGNVNTDPIGVSDLSLSPTPSTGSNSASVADFSEVIAKMSQVLDAFQRFPGTLRAEVSLSDIESAAGELSEIQEKAGF